MLICVPSNGNRGLEETICGHFGSAASFTLYDTDSGDTKVLDNRNAHHDHGTCHPLNQLGQYKIDCMVCSGMGRRAIEALNAAGIKIFLAESETVGEAVDKMKAGTLQEIDPAKACRGHGQRGGGCAHGPLAPGDVTGSQSRG